MDVGSFIFEADGVRWAIDMGGEDYDRLENAGWICGTERKGRSDGKFLDIIIKRIIRLRLMINRSRLKEKCR